MPKSGGRLWLDTRLGGASGGRSRPSLAIVVKVSTARPSSEASRMPLFMYRCPFSGYRVQGFVAEDTSEDGQIYEPVTCPVCHQIHHVNPHTGIVLGEKAAALRPDSPSK
jgi:hypothetical protein